MKAFVIDLNKCNGCYACQIVCKDEHVANDWTPIAKPQPDTGQFWCKVNERVRGTVPKVKVAYLPVICMHCDDASCIPACPVDAIYRRNDGLVIIDPVKCTGCQNCLSFEACPYGVIYFNEDLNIAQKCTGCAHLLDNGWKEPRCADACPIEALKFGEEADLDLGGTEILHPEYGLSPRVFYKYLPKRFVAGTVFDSVADEVVIDATCTLTGEGGPYTQKTDAFGDFWFEGVPASTFSLEIEAAGYATKTLDVNTEAEDVGLPDIDLA